MRFSVETWSSEYGTPMASDIVQSDVVPDVGREVSADYWSPLRPSTDPARDVLFVDGVRRVDANLWIEQSGSDPVLGLCASYSAGAIRSVQNTARLVASRVERCLFTVARQALDVATRYGTYAVQPTKGSTPEELWLAIQDRMGRLEGQVSGGLSGMGLVVVDGPLSHHRHVPDAVGYVKTHHRYYLPEKLRGILPALPAGCRTPLFFLGNGTYRWSWYLRVAQGAGPMGGIVRCELAADRAVTDAARMADLVTATLPRYASEEHKDPRAPQNLYPVGALERQLHHRMGDQQLLFRALRQAAIG